MVANGEAEMMIYWWSTTRRWDSCAPEAIIKSLGGYFATPYGKQLVYDPNGDKEFKNKEGFFCTLNK